MGVTPNHVHEVLVRVHGEGGTSYAYHHTFVGPPGRVEITHHSQPLMALVEAPLPPAPERDAWEDYDTGEWGTIGDEEGDDTPGGHAA